MSADVFKILRCKDPCGWMRRDAEPVAEIPPCPRCGKSPSYSKNWYIRIGTKIKSIGPHKRQAEQVRNKQQMEAVHNKYLRDEDEAPLLSVAIETVYQDKWKRNKDGERQKTRSERILDILGDLPLDEINKREYRKLVAALEKDGNGDSTINRYLACLKTIKRRHKQDYSFIEMLDESEGRIYVITVQEENKIIETLKNKVLRRWPKRQNYLDEFADMAIILVDTGLRIGEILKLTARDINLKTNLLTTWINKADKPRSIPMTDRSRAILEPRMERVALFSCNQNQIGQSWDIVRAALKNYDEDFVPHAFRHTCATRLLESGADIYTVKEWLGHRTIQTTLRYAHLQPGRLAKAATALQEFFNESLT